MKWKLWEKVLWLTFWGQLAFCIYSCWRAYGLSCFPIKGRVWETLRDLQGGFGVDVELLKKLWKMLWKILWKIVNDISWSSVEESFSTPYIMIYDSYIFKRYIFVFRQMARETIWQAEHHTNQDKDQKLNYGYNFGWFCLFFLMSPFQFLWA